jgi:hypothetical protein
MKYIKRFFLFLFPDKGEAEAGYNDREGKNAKAKLTWKW